MEIQDFFNLLGPSLRSAALLSLSRGNCTVVLGLGCNHARHRSPVAAFLAAHCLKQHVAHVKVNSQNITRACGCCDCRLFTDQPGLKDALDLSLAAFAAKFHFRGVSSNYVEVPGTDNSGFSQADAHPEHAVKGGTCGSQLPGGLTHLPAGPDRRGRSRSPVLQQNMWFAAETVLAAPKGLTVHHPNSHAAVAVAMHRYIIQNMLAICIMWQVPVWDYSA